MFWLHDESGVYESGDFYFLFSNFLTFGDWKHPKSLLFRSYNFKIFVFWREISPVKKENADADGWQIRSEERSVRRCCRAMMIVQYDGENIGGGRRWRRRSRPACLPACVQLASTTDHKTVIKFRLLAWSVQYFPL